MKEPRLKWSLTIDTTADTREELISQLQQHVKTLAELKTPPLDSTGAGSEVLITSCTAVHISCDPNYMHKRYNHELMVLEEDEFDHQYDLYADEDEDEEQTHH